MSLQKERIGTTLTVVWEVLTNGDAVSLEGRDIRVFAIDPHKKRTEMTDLQIGGSAMDVVTCVFEGKEQEHLGIYQLECIENYNKANQAVLDDDVIMLVPRSKQRTGGSIGLATPTIQLTTGTLWVGVKGKDGKSAYELAVAEGYEGTVTEWLASLHGQDADIAAAVAATNAANAAAAAANDAAEDAEDATTAANTAASAANTAASSANAGEVVRQQNEAQRNANETNRQNSEARRQQTFQTNEAARRTAYQNAEANRNGAYQDAEDDRDEIFNSKEATRDAANEAALNCADTLAALGPKTEREKSLTLFPLLGAYFNESGSYVITAYASMVIYYTPVKAGQRFHVTASNSSSKLFRLGYTTETPAVGVQVTIVSDGSTTSVDTETTAPNNGYLVTGCSLGNFTNQAVSVIEPVMEVAAQMQSKLDERTTSPFADIPTESIISRKGYLSMMTATSTYVTKNHWYISRTHNTSALGNDSYSEYILVTVAGGDVIKLNPVNGTSPHAPRVLFFTERPAAPSSSNSNYSDVTGIMLGSVISVTSQMELVVPDGATSMYIEQAYAAKDVTTPVDISPTATIRNMNYNIYEDLQDVKEDLDEAEETIEQQGEELDKKGFAFVELPRPHYSGKRLYRGDTASNRDGKWYSATNSSYWLIPVAVGDKIRIEADRNTCVYAFLINNTNGSSVVISGTTFYEANYAPNEEMHTLAPNEIIEVTVPEGTVYLYVYQGSSVTRSSTPKSVAVKRSWEDCMELGIGGDILELNPEVTMLDKVKSMAYKGKTDERNNVWGCFVFAHITDCHGRDTEAYSQSSWERFIRFCEYYKAKNDRYIIDIVDTGDVVADSAAVGGEAVTMDWRTMADNVLTVVGNHDVANKATSSSSLAYTRIGLAAYNQFLADNIGNWDVVQPTDAATEGYCYYYKDYEIGGGEDANTTPTPYGLRAIFIDAMDWLVNGSASLDYHQAAFVKNALDGALSEGRHVIIFAHEWPGAMVDFDCHYNTSPYNVHYQDIADSNSKVANDSIYTYLAYLVAKFQQSGGGFAGYVCGHHHAGFIGRKTGTCTFNDETIDFDGGTPQIIICGQYARLMQTQFTSQSGNMSWVGISTRNQDCFRLIGIDTSHKYVKVMQIGRNVDYAMRDIDAICINYNTYQEFDEEVTTYTRNSIVAKDGFLWRILAPAFKDVEGVTHTDWNNSIKVIYNRVMNQ